MVEVTAEDGTTTDTYSVTIYRERRVPSNDADLSALSLSGVTLSSSVRLCQRLLTWEGRHTALIKPRCPTQRTSVLRLQSKRLAIDGEVL